MACLPFSYGEAAAATTATSAAAEAFLAAAAAEAAASEAAAATAEAPTSPTEEATVAALSTAAALTTSKPTPSAALTTSKPAAAAAAGCHSKANHHVGPGLRAHLCNRHRGRRSERGLGALAVHGHTSFRRSPLHRCGCCGGVVVQPGRRHIM